MDVGIFAKTFVRSSLEATFDAVARYGLQSVQFNMACAGLDSMPDRIPSGLAERIHLTAAERSVNIAAVSGTFNMAHPDPFVRQQGVERLGVLAAACRPIGVSVITLCTGTRDPDDMWRRHPENESAAAWRDMMATVGAALAIAEEHDVTLAFEPEPGNVVNSAARGLRLLREARSPHLRVVVDPANVVATDESRVPATVLEEAFDLLGEQVAVAHAKDLGEDGRPCAAGTGIVPWDRYVSLLRKARFEGPLILHGLTEDEVPASVAFVRDRISGVSQDGRLSSVSSEHA
jgi:sugar phosphate isomerase/epimerase